MIKTKKKKAAFNLSSKQQSREFSTGVVKARHQWTNLALPCVAGTQSFEKPYKNRLMQNQAMEITAVRAMRHRAILCDFASPDSQIAMETSISGCRIARFCFSVTGLLRSPDPSRTSSKTDLLSHKRTFRKTCKVLQCRTFSIPTGIYPTHFRTLLFGFSETFGDWRTLLMVFEAKTEPVRERAIV